MAAGSAQGCGSYARDQLIPAGAIARMATLDDIFDDANGDLAIGELESAVEKYRQSQCSALDSCGPPA